MKREELKAYNVVATADVNPEVVDSLGCTEWTGYDKDEVDAVIEELKAENERLKATPEQIMKEIFDKVLIYPNELVSLDDAYKLAVETKQAKRALWLARAMRAHDRSKRILRDAGIMFAVGKCHEWDIWNSLQKKWQRVADKCRKKAEEYK